MPFFFEHLVPFKWIIQFTLILFPWSCAGPVLLSWKEFYKEMFQTFDLQTIILTLNRILKTSDGDIYVITKSLMTKLQSNHLHNPDETLHEMAQHPVHIVDEKGDISPSSFIPFCEFGGNMSVMGVKTDKFSVPVCNSFKPTVLNDRLCYRINLNDFKSSQTSEVDLKKGFIFFIDHNEDRQTKIKDDETINYNLFESFVQVQENKKSFIYIETIGRCNLFSIKI